LPAKRAGAASTDSLAELRQDIQAGLDGGEPTEYAVKEKNTATRRRQRQPQ